MQKLAMPGKLPPSGNTFGSGDFLKEQSAMHVSSMLGTKSA